MIQLVYFTPTCLKQTLVSWQKMHQSAMHLLYHCCGTMYGGGLMPPRYTSIMQQHWHHNNDIIEVASGGIFVVIVR